ncbi:MAG: sigma-70 family RNA polymerase sigma factor [Verrucomicrobiota bacterium]
MSDTTDHELLLAYIQKADEAAFATLVRRHADLVFGSALRQVRDRGAAEEVTQNVFTALARKARWLTGQGGLAGWLYRTTILETRFWQRTEARRRAREQRAFELGTTMKPDDSSSLIPLLDDGLMELAEKDRHAVVSRFFEGKSFREVGASLGTGEDAAQKRVQKSLQQVTRFFQRHGYATVTAGTVVRALESAAMTAPAEVVAKIASVAGAAGAASSFTTVGILIAKFMSLTKVQTVALCLLVGAAPVGYEWNAAAQSRAARSGLESRVSQLGRQIETEHRQNAHWQRRIEAVLDATSASQREMARLREVIAIARTGQESGLYLWSEDSDYVRVPKLLAQQIVLSGSHELPGATPVTRDQDAPVLADGSLSQALSAALGVSDHERDTLSQAFTDFTRGFRENEATRTYFTNAPPQDFHVGNLPSQTIVTLAAPPAEAEQARATFRGQLDGILGSERAGVLWKQAERLFRDQYNDFGSLELVQSVAFHSAQEISTWQALRRPGESGFVSWSNASGPLTLESVPEKLRPIVAEWRARHAETSDQIINP